MSDKQTLCELCGDPMPPGEQMFKYHGYSGPCPKPPLPKPTPTPVAMSAERLARARERVSEFIKGERGPYTGLPDDMLKIQAALAEAEASLAAAVAERDSAELRRHVLHDELERTTAFLVEANEKLDAIQTAAAAAREENERLTKALRIAVKVADEAREVWDNAPAGMKAGKLLIALSGHLPGYRVDIDAVHATLQPRQSE